MDAIRAEFIVQSFEIGLNFMTQSGILKDTCIEMTRTDSKKSGKDFEKKRGWLVKKLLYTASTFSHLAHFHRIYLQAFREAGWEVHIAAAGTPVSIPEAHRVISLPFTKRMTARANFEAAMQLRKIMREESYRLIITHTALASFFTRFAIPHGYRGKVITMVHGYLFDDAMPIQKQMLFRLAEKSMAKKTDKIITMNEWDYEAAIHNRFAKIVCKVPGVGVPYEKLQVSETLRRTQRQALSIPEDAFVMVYAAEFSKRKHQAFLIYAMKKLPPHCRLLLLGEGSLLSDMKLFAAECGVADRIVFAGYVTELSPWYAAADIAVSASRIEGLPFNIMEAMYCGLPVVATAIKGHTDLILQGKNGLLYPYDDTQAFVQAVLRCIEYPDFRQTLGACAHTDSLQYAQETVFPQVMQAYLEHDYVVKRKQKKEVHTP